MLTSNVNNLKEILLFPVCMFSVAERQFFGLDCFGFGLGLSFVFFPSPSMFFVVIPDCLPAA